jgi:hypothetical protein
MDKQATGLRSPDRHKPEARPYGEDATGSQSRFPRKKIRKRVALALAIATLSGGAALLMARLAPASIQAQKLASIVSLPQVPAALAQAALEESPSNLSLARDLTLKELSVAPSHAEAWLRLAYIETSQSGDQLSPPANAALKKAYALAPVDTKFASWRLRFILEHWQSADPAVRAFAMDEIDVLWRETSFRRSMRSLLPNLVNPSGQMALSLRVQTLERRASTAFSTP